MVDFTNPDARTWIKDIIKNNLLKEGRAVGWMADFAEYTPLNIKINRWNKYSGTYHNQYPDDWAQINKEAIEEFGTTDETVYFMRSGTYTSPAKTRLYWMGDQLPTLDKFDGLHSALIGLLNGGVVGFGLGHSDIGGYTSVDDVNNYLVYRRDEEILMRWCEMNAFSDAVFRTHPSNKPDFNVQVWDSDKLSQFFKKFVEVFVGLGDYRK